MEFDYKENAPHGRDYTFPSLMVIDIIRQLAPLWVLVLNVRKVFFFCIALYKEVIHQGVFLGGKRINCCMSIWEVGKMGELHQFPA